MIVSRLRHLSHVGLPVSILLGSCGLMALVSFMPWGISWDLRMRGPAGCLLAANPVEEYEPTQYMTGVIYRGGNPTIEGYGSYFQHYKGEIVAAMYLKKTLIFQDDVPSEHGYNVSPQVNAVHRWPGMPSNHSSTACVHRSYWGAKRIRETDLLTLMCLHMSPKSFKKPADMFAALGNINDTAPAMTAAGALANWTATYANCSVINSLGRKNKHEALNDCIQPWLSYTLRGMFANRGFKSVLANNGCLNVGIHIRWGDVAHNNTRSLGGRNMRGHEMVFTLQKLKNITSQCLNYYIFAKNAIPELVEQFEIEHTLIDGEDDLYDMYLYSLMDVYIQGVSSWSIMPTYVHSGRVLITDKPSHPKLKTTFRETNFIYHYKNLAYINHIARLRPMSAERAAGISSLASRWRKEV